MDATNGAQRIPVAVSHSPANLLVSVEPKGYCPARSRAIHIFDRVQTMSLDLLHLICLLVKKTSQRVFHIRLMQAKRVLVFVVLTSLHEKHLLHENVRNEVV